MPAMCIALALAIVVVAAIAIVKKLDVRIVLLVAGMALNILALAFGAENILPKGAQTSGLSSFWKTFFQKELNPLVWFSLTFLRLLTPYL